MRASFTSDEVAKAIRQDKWNDFYTNLKRADLSIFPPRSRGQEFSFAHALECDFQNRIGSRYSRQLAKLAFHRFILDMQHECSASKDVIEETPNLFLKYTEGEHYVVFTVATANDPTMAFFTSDLSDAYARMRRLAIGTPTHPASQDVSAEQADSLIIVNVSAIIRRLIKALSE